MSINQKPRVLLCNFYVSTVIGPFPPSDNENLYFSTVADQFSKLRVWTKVAESGRCSITTCLNHVTQAYHVGRISHRALLKLYFALEPLLKLYF